ncbi:MULTISPECIES: class I SAM-dependent methyltransferase [Rhodococcus]|uniref:Putative 3-demethylubiquinone-9 3-methyltransferase n=2 Tax=Nocardiaceae TaxID=85025 RepID=A0A098BR36_9NOCA|nr:MULTISPECIES: methyltransferase domain-containing protein [Rhodococcus]AUM19229.1 methyltransferase domain-containing protein [Rhodococcus ruber]MBD8057239.1 methyltransferase domain-containing protein [Rhodococcus ruber]MCD2130074.1 methyltransferase domain-containing protein [Rhodococcus ruber]CDZ90181.1 putative 3-demethylubiquinone-9 3-methyltransferase [Rhodococcus ruber]
MTQPPMDAQVRFWTEWVEDSAPRENNPGNERRGKYVLEAVRSVTRPNMRILDIGCGTGWLSLQLAEFGTVTALDLPSKTIDRLKTTHPEITWISGDFLTTDLPQGFDVVVSVETIAHVPDQEKFVRKIAALLVPGGTVVLTTQNPPIWNRTRALRPPGPGQIRNWPSRARLQELFTPYFDLQPLRTCAPSGDRGPLRLLHNRISRAVGTRLFGRERWIRWRERVGLGCSLVLVGTLAHPVE